MIVVIECDGKDPINFDLKSDYITLDYLRQYFSEAEGLKYKKDGCWFGADFENGKFKIKPDVTNYKVHLAACPKVAITARKKFAFHDILRKIKTKSKPDIEEELKKESTPKPKIGKIKQEKSVNIGWKHRDSIESEFYKPNSGTKRIILDVKKVYKVADVKDIAIKSFKNDYNEKFFYNSTCQICLANGTPINAFTSTREDDEEENLWHCRNILDKAGRILTLYLETTGTKKVDKNKRILDISSKTSINLLSESKNVNLSKSLCGKISEKGDKIDNNNDVSRNNDKAISSHSTDKGKNPESIFLEKLPDCKTLLKPSNTLDSSPPFKKPKFNLQDISKLQVPLVVEIPKENLEFHETFLGRGSFGYVQKGKWNGTKVAINMYTIETLLVNAKDVIKEVAVLRQVSHQNIVSIMGICVEQFKFHIVMELVDGNSLYQIISNDSIKLKYIKKLYNKNLISSQICRAITFLYMHPQHFLHRDIKPGNILINQNKIVKVCDLGLATMRGALSQLQSTVGKRQIIGTPIYMAPEIYFSKNEFTQFADVWSLGCTLLEFHDEKPMWKENFLCISSLEQILKRETVPEIKSVPEFLRDVLKQCFEYDFQKRPLAKEILKAFEAIGIDN